MITEPNPATPKLRAPRLVPRQRMSWFSIASLMRLLYEGPHTMRELIGETGLAESTVRGYVLALRRQRLVAVVSRLVSRNGNPSIHVYQWKPGAKDYYVKKKTSAERQAASRQRRKDAERNAALGTEIRTPLPRPPAGYTAEELERDNPYNAWVRP